MKKITKQSNSLEEDDIITFEKISLGTIPIMLHSKFVFYNHTSETLKNMGECPYEQGGYFIIDGKKK